MKLDLLRIYQQYVTYYSGFQAKYDQLANPRLSKRLRAPLMTYEEFAITWMRWCEQGQEQHWRERLEKGHEHHTMKSVAAIKALFICSETNMEVMATREAA